MYVYSLLIFKIENKTTNELENSLFTNFRLIDKGSILMCLRIEFKILDTKRIQLSQLCLI